MKKSKICFILLLVITIFLTSSEIFENKYLDQKKIKIYITAVENILNNKLKNGSYDRDFIVTRCKYDGLLSPDGFGETLDDYLVKKNEIIKLDYEATYVLNILSHLLYINERETDDYTRFYIINFYVDNDTIWFMARSYQWWYQFGGKIVEKNGMKKIENISDSLTPNP